MLKKFNKLIKDHSTSNDIRRSVGVGNILNTKLHILAQQFWRDVG
jgi:hypothetical protein